MKWWKLIDKRLLLFAAGWVTAIVLALTIIFVFGS